MKNLSASDRSALIRLASSLPEGDESRRSILAGLVSSAKVRPADHPLVAEGNFKLVQFGDSIIKAFKDAVKPQSKGSIRIVRDAKKTFYSAWIVIRGPEADLFTVAFGYDKNKAPHVHLYKYNQSGPRIPIPASTGIDSDGTIRVDTSSPDKLIRFLLGYLKDETAGFNIFKGDNSNPEASKDDAKKLIASIFAAFKKLAKASGVPLDTDMDKYPLAGEKFGPSKWVMSRDSVYRYSPDQIKSLKKSWDATVAKYAPNMNQLGVSSGYIPPEPSDLKGFEDRIRGTGQFILEIL